MSEHGNGALVAEDLRRRLRLLTRSTLALTLSVILVAGYGLYALKVQSDRSTSALCALRADLERRVAASEDFLSRNPKGFPGISSAVLQKSIVDQQRTIVALAGLHCPPTQP